MGFTASSKRGRGFRPPRIPLHLIFLVRVHDQSPDFARISTTTTCLQAFASLLTLWLVVLPIYDVFLERSAGLQVDPGVSSHDTISPSPSCSAPDAAFVNAHLDQTQPRVEKSLEHLSDLEVVKASKAAADRAAAQDEAVCVLCTQTNVPTHTRTITAKI